MKDFIEAELEKLNQLGEGRVRFMGVRQEFNDFLRSHDQRLIDKIVEMVEGKKVVEASLPSDDPRVLMWKARHNKTLNEILTTLKGK